MHFKCCYLSGNVRYSLHLRRKMEQKLHHAHIRIIFFLLCLLPAILKTLLPSAYRSDTLTHTEQGSSSWRNFVSTVWNFFLCMKNNCEIWYYQCKRCSSETITLTASHSSNCCSEALNNITKDGVSSRCEKFVRWRCSL